MTEKKLAALLAEMSLEEKVMQLVQLPGSAYDDTANITGNELEPVDPRVKQLAGSTLGILSGKTAKKIQQEYMAAHPHHIPLLLMADVIHGYRTVFPCPLGLGATFDPEIVEQAASAQAEEAAADGIQVTFSPMADLVRDARWGRVMESTGEDKVLNGRMAAAMVRGYQGGGALKDEHTVASCVKHYAAYGAADGGRDYNNTELSEHTLREDYLPAYAEGIRAGARMIMSSFNSWNGIPVTGNAFLLKQILRSELGFDGVVISDWDAVGQLIPHGFAEDRKDAARKAFQAGVDIDMCTGAYADHLTELVRDGEIAEKEIDGAVMRVLRLKNDLGLFENPLRGFTDCTRNTTLEERRALARKAVAESLVLLKNEENLLPLRGKRIAFIGPYADSRELISTWAMAGEKEPVVSVMEGAAAAFAHTKTEIRISPGCTLLDNDTVVSFYQYHSDTWEEENERMLAEALKTASWADTVVLCLGEHPMQSGESTSRADLHLPKVQEQLLEAVAAVCPQVATLVFCGRPLALSSVAGRSKALMICWLPGTEGGNGILDVLTGKMPPMGRLPMSFPWTVGQEPLHYDCYATGRPKPAEGLGSFTTRYLDYPNEALYPFGFGLSYGDTVISDPAVSAVDLSEKGELTVTAILENRGDACAAHTVQLYLRDVSASRVRPVRELKDFRRLTLRPGEKREVRFTVTESMLRFWRADGTFGSEPGKFQVWISLSSRQGNPAEFVLKG